MGLKATDAIIVTLDDEGSVVSEKLVQVKIEGKGKIIAGVESQFYHRSFVIAVICTSYVYILNTWTIFYKKVQLIFHKHEKIFQRH
jgi:hypothetical protein